MQLDEASFESGHSTESGCCAARSRTRSGASDSKPGAVVQARANQSFGVSQLHDLEILTDGNPGIIRVLDDGQFFDRTNPQK